MDILEVIEDLKEAALFVERGGYIR